MGQLRIYMKKVTATFMLMPGNSRLGSCVHFEVTLPKGKVLDITGDRLSDKEKAFESAFDKANSILSKFDMILKIEDALELAEYDRPYVDADSRYFLCGNHQNTSNDQITITKRRRVAR